MDTFYLLIFLQKSKPILATKYTISMALMIENPVSSPMVPPIADNWSENFAALSLVTLSNAAVSKYILTNLNLGFFLKSG